MEVPQSEPPAQGDSARPGPANGLGLRIPSLPAPPGLSLPPSKRHRVLSSLFFGIGFLFFGLALGDITGFSLAQGISQALLSSLFTFVGGVLLSFGGFQVTARSTSKSDPAPSTAPRVRVNAERLGIGLGCFSLGVLVGVNLGVLSRCNVHLQRFFLGEDVARSQCAAPGSEGPPGSAEAPQPKGVSATGIGLQSTPEGTDCDSRRNDLEVALGRSSATESLRASFDQFAKRCERR